MIENDASIRTSYVGSFQLINTGLSSVIQFGDSASISAKSSGLAVQRQLDNRAGGEVDFASYDLFSTPFSLPQEESADAADIRTRTVNPNPSIMVGTVNIITCSSASVVLTGNAMDTLMESRLKHFRQYAYSLGSTSVPNPALSQAIETAHNENDGASAGPSGSESPSSSGEAVTTTRDN
ncbi:spore germination protein GerPE [Paenibacillus humicus]|uniref:spore germination protein GerPE n=1 Tax=Paenibacillus humicus TaxID=412861 RepID=UPI000FD864A6|nr:spore germination protein GerPE [Paenibacillus humicus]